MRFFFSYFLFFLLIVTLSSGKVVAQGKHPIIAFTSDTQEPMWVEKFLLKSDHNLEATNMIFKDVNTLHPAALFILGDVVSLGKSKRAWKNIDADIMQAAKESIPVYATLGNHEVMFNTQKGTRNFKARFPMYDPKGYVKIIDSVAVILLNSNFGAMTKTEISNQNIWYLDMLNTLDSSSAVKFIIVGCHHSPYTNSKIVKPSLAVRENFVHAFIRSKKCALFLSGHSHNFERFLVEQKYFLVIGGGGGLHQPLHADNGDIHDLSFDYKPAFHYLKVTRVRDTLQLTSRRLKKDFSGFVDSLIIKIAPHLNKSTTAIMN